MKNRQKYKALKKVAEEQAEHMRKFGYTAEVAKLQNGHHYIVRAENKYEKVSIFVDRFKRPFNTWTMKKKGVVKI